MRSQCNGAMPIRIIKHEAVQALHEAQTLARGERKIKL